MDALISGWQAMGGWELLAVLFSLAYLVLAIRQNPLCWPAAFASTAIYTVVFWQAALLMESALNVYYLLMAVYGYWRWQQGNQAHSPRPVIRWNARQHLLACATIAALTLISGRLLTDHTHAALPYLDAFTTWSAVITTWMVARKVLENWLYWLVINAVSIYLLSSRGLMLTAGLMVVFEVMAVIGFWRWWQSYKAQRPAYSNDNDPSVTAPSEQGS